MSIQLLQTSERVSQKDHSDNYVFQRSLLAYLEAAKRISGKVLEIGTGSGYGVEIIAPHTDEFVTVDKYHADITNITAFKEHNVQFVQLNIPPLSGIASDAYDYVITFQVIEHIPKDHFFLEEISRVLKPGGQLIVTTPNKKNVHNKKPLACT